MGASPCHASNRQPVAWIQRLHAVPLTAAILSALALSAPAAPS
jgi:hypothetical protein